MSQTVNFAAEGVKSNHILNLKRQTVNLLLLIKSVTGWLIIMNFFRLLKLFFKVFV